jgi:hypothetical protein
MTTTKTTATPATSQTQIRAVLDEWAAALRAKNATSSTSSAPWRCSPPGSPSALLEPPRGFVTRRGQMV